MFVCVVMIYKALADVRNHLLFAALTLASSLSWPLENKMCSLGENFAFVLALKQNKRGATSEFRKSSDHDVFLFPYLHSSVFFM